jgi:acetoin utilization deacetylase AcuC-like enzyme
MRQHQVKAFSGWNCGKPVAWKQLPASLSGRVNYSRESSIIGGVDMKRTGVFYHEICGKEAYSSLAMGVEAGFKGIEKEGIFSRPNVTFFESKPAVEEEIARIHSQKWIDNVKQTQWWRVSLYSIGGVLQATEKVLNGEINNALVIAGVGGHHAHRDNAWGGCYFNVTGLAIPHARAKLKAKRFAIVDTDTHHADGTRDIFQDDEDVLHICFCGNYLWSDNSESKTESKTKLCFPHGSSDEEEIENVKKEVPERIKEFKPELVFWVCGMDTHQDSYGTRALTEKCYPQLAEIIKETADGVCEGKLIVKTCCNAPPHATRYAMPRIVNCLAEL